VVARRAGRADAQVGVGMGGTGVTTVGRGAVVGGATVVGGGGGGVVGGGAVVTGASVVVVVVDVVVVRAGAMVERSTWCFRVTVRWAGEVKAKADTVPTRVTTIRAARMPTRRWRRARKKAIRARRLDTDGGDIFPTLTHRPESATSGYPCL
jgi:hypothetical protein